MSKRGPPPVSWRPGMWTWRSPRARLPALAAIGTRPATRPTRTRRAATDAWPRGVGPSLAGWRASPPPVPVAGRRRDVAAPQGRTGPRAGDTSPEGDPAHDRGSAASPVQPGPDQPRVQA